MRKPLTAVPLAAADWARARALFELALDLPAERRHEFVCGSGDTDTVRNEVLALMLHCTEADAGAELLDAPVGAALLPPPRDGVRLGSWRLDHLIGAGGMGDVYRARRADGGYTGEAAVKILKRGMDSVAVLKRFSQEQQALATLNHPHIARLFDAGLTPDGLPYFVMELVEGEDIDRACEGLPLAKRLQVFLQLTDAVAYAHRMLLVHRDLKPGNVLVTPEGTVKLLDFGIAKALDSDTGEAGAADLTGTQRPFSPSHASPEQVRGERVGTATDIYSLGVLLYQLLTGVRPTGRTATTPAEAARSVLEEMPTRPSSLTPAAVRDPNWLANRRRLQGDLDNILMKALEKPVERRYASVDAMAADVQAYLRGFPVSANAPSAVYVAGKFLRRHRWAAAAVALGCGGLLVGLAAALLEGRAAVALGMVGLATGLCLALVQGRRAVVARDTAQARFDDVRQLTHAVLFDYHDLIEALPGATPVRKRLVNDALGYLERLAQAAPADRELRREMGVAYRVVGVVQRNGNRRPHLGDTAGAHRSYERSIAILSALAAEDARDAQSGYQLGLALSARGAMLGEDGDYAAAGSDLRRANAMFLQHLSRDTPAMAIRLELARSHLRLCSAARRNRDLEGTATALDEGRAVLAAMARLRPDHPELPHVWVWVHNLDAEMARERGEWAFVTRAKLAARELLIELHARDPDNARYLEDLAGTARWLLIATGPQGDVAGAERWGVEACERCLELARQDPEDRIGRGVYLDVLILSGGQLVEAGAADRGLERLAAVRPLLALAMQRWKADSNVRARELFFVCAEAGAHGRLNNFIEAHGALQRGQAIASAGTSDFNDDAVMQIANALLHLTRAKMLLAQAVREPAITALPLRAEAAAALGSCLSYQNAAAGRATADIGYWVDQLREASALLRKIRAADASLV